MSRLSWTVALCAVSVALNGSIAAAQQAPSSRSAAKAEQRSEPSKTESSTWDETKEMTRKEWNVAKRKWAQEKTKWNDCNHQSSRQKLEAHKSWSFIASCMTKT
jgi:Ni/Co efflux regulator RcnB